MKKILLLPTIALTLGICSGCNLFKYFDKKVNVYREKDVVDKQISLRYFFNQIHVPYIEVNEYYKEFFNKNLKINKNDEGYKYSLSDNEFLYFNVKDNSISISELTSFALYPSGVSESANLFLKVDSVESTESKVKTIDLNKYNIHFYDYDEKIYAPLSFLSTLCGGVSLYDIAYNGKDVYVLDYGGDITGEEKTTNYYGDKYSKKIESLSLRNKDMAEYSYNELCFVFDNLRGETTQLLFGDQKLKQLGLDGLLSTYYPEIKDLLLSLGKRKYFAGLLSLFFGLDDGGHTALTTYYPMMLLSIFTKINGIEPLSTLLNQINARDDETSKVYQSCDYSRSMMLGTPGDNYYYLDQESEVAYIGFDSFDVDYTGWDNYYKGVGNVPIDTDTFAFVRDKLYKAKNIGVKNVVLDISTNGGGNTNALNGLIGLFNCAKSDCASKDTFNEYDFIEHYSVDINLDGKFDELDTLECEKFDFNIAVLTSKYSFSCANLFPSMMKELGYMTVGQRSGGGSCAISVDTTAEGIAYVRSSHLTAYNFKGENVDIGVPVDYEIETPDNVFIELYDATDFYNTSLMKEVLTNFYSTR